MRFKKAILMLLLGFIALISESCGGKSVSPSGHTFNIFLDYWNDSGQNPQIKLDNLQTSSEVKIDFTKTFGGAIQNNIAKVIIDNFRIIDANMNNYNIKTITAYEYSNDSKSWLKDVEFTMAFNQSEDISLVLALDRSLSLGTDFANIQQYASDFVDKVLTDHPNAKIGIVDFADDVKQFALSNDKAAIKNYIKSLKQGQFTSLYQGIEMGIGMLNNSKSQSKVLFTFTDGTDNMAPAGLTANTLVNEIKSDNNTYKISSFCIGLNGSGSVDKTVLNSLALNGGSTSFPENISQLKDAFTKFGSVISNVYNLTYNRNQQIIAKSNPRKLKFLIETSN